MIKFIELYIGAILLWIAAYIVGKVLLSPRKEKAIKTISSIIIFSLLLVMLNMINSEIMHGIIKILIVYLLQCLYFKIVFNLNLSKCMIVALTWYLSLCLSEVIIALILSAILGTMNNRSLEFLKNTAIINALITSFEVVLVIKTKKTLTKFINNANYSAKSSIIAIISILIALSLLIFRVPVNYWKFDVEFIVTMIILMCFCVVGLYLFKQKSDIEETNSRYRQEVKYSKLVNKVTEEYRMINHEHKNQLSIIRGMADSKNKKLLDYIDTLIEKKNDIKYKWVSQIGYIPLDGLKSLINYKLLQMEELRINIIVNISKEIPKTRIKTLTINQQDELYSMIGIYLDNAMQAAANSKKKQVSINIYKENKDLVFIIGNTYKGRIDINRLDEYGYTTKGKNHGTGLHIVQKILADNDYYHAKRDIIDDYYIQELRIKLVNLKSNKKKKTTK